MLFEGKGWERVQPGDSRYNDRAIPRSDGPR